MPLEPKKRGSRWTVQEDSLMTELWKRGAGDREIAEKVGRSPKAVENRRTALGMTDDRDEPAEEAKDPDKSRVRPGRPDLFALWDARNTRLRERLMAEGRYPLGA